MTAYCAACKRVVQVDHAGSPIHPKTICLECGRTWPGRPKP